MGILDDVRAAADRRAGRHRGRRRRAQARRRPGEFSGGEIEIVRGDLARLLYERTAATCEYVFGDSITSLTETADGVDVTFERAAPADVRPGRGGGRHPLQRPPAGLRAGVGLRPAPRLLLRPGRRGRRAASRRDVQRAGPDGGDRRRRRRRRSSSSPPSRSPTTATTSSSRSSCSSTPTAAARWRIPELLAQLPAAREFYLDSISRVTMDRYTSGRVALLGRRRVRQHPRWLRHRARHRRRLRAGRRAAPGRRRPHGRVRAVRGHVPRLRQGLAEGQRRPAPGPADPPRDAPAEPAVLGRSSSRR